jgi:GTP-binding protein
MAEEYLSNRQELSLSIQLVDARHSPSQLDRQLNEWLIFHKKPHLVVATKSDKISNNELATQLRSIRKDFGSSTVLPYSSASGSGGDEIWEKIVAAAGEK